MRASAGCSPNAKTPSKNWPVGAWRLCELGRRSRTTRPARVRSTVLRRRASCRCRRAAACRGGGQRTRSCVGHVARTASRKRTLRAAVRSARGRCIPTLRDLGTWLRTGLVPGVSSRRRRSLLLQHGAWPRRRRTWWITSSRMLRRRGSGCCRCRLVSVYRSRSSDAGLCALPRTGRACMIRAATPGRCCFSDRQPCADPRRLAVLDQLAVVQQAAMLIALVHPDLDGVCDQDGRGSGVPTTPCEASVTVCGVAASRQHIVMMISLRRLASDVY